MEMNIAKAIGIIAIIACHTKWNIFGDFVVSVWHVPLFFFISGYFFNINKTFISHIKTCLKKYLGWFYTYHFFYGGITVLVYLWFDRLYGKMPGLKTLTISAIDSTPFEFNVPNWFLMQLAISLTVFALIIYAFKKVTKNCFAPAVIFVPLAITAIVLAKSGCQPSHGLIKVIIKTFISMYYIYAGWLYRNELEKRIPYNISTLSLVFIIHLIVLLFCKEKGFSINSAKLSHNIYPLIAPFTGIYLVLFISKLLAPIVRIGSFVDKIGRNTLHIMANHVFIIFLIELLIFTIDGKSFTDLPHRLINGFYKMSKYKFLYTFGSLIICTYMGELLSHVTAKFKNKFSSVPQQLSNHFLHPVHKLYKKEAHKT